MIWGCTELIINASKANFDVEADGQVHLNLKRQKVSKKIEFDGLDKFSNHYLAKINELPIGTARVREQKKGTFKIERMAVLKRYRKKGVGKAIIKKILKHYLNLNRVSNLILNSQIEAKDFYKKLGFVEVGEEFIEANITHKKMIYNF